MIRSKKELRFFIMADRIMNGATPRRSIKEWVIGLIRPNYILDYLKHMRSVAYYRKNNKFLFLWHYFFYHRLGVKLGFSIYSDSFGYGLVIPHYGTIVVSSDLSAGNYCVLHTSTCIGGGKKLILNGLYLSAGAQIFKPLTLGENVTISPNSLVTHSCKQNNVTLAGCPAKVVREGTQPWWERDGEKFVNRVNKVEELKRRLNL